MNRLVLIIVLWVSFSLQALAAETISSGVLAKGTQWETTFYRRDSGQVTRSQAIGLEAVTRSVSTANHPISSPANGEQIGRAHV